MADDRPDLNGTILTVEQDIPVRDTGTVMTVTALPTGVDGLVICPAVGLDAAGETAYFSGRCTLTHAPTGRSIMHGDDHHLRTVAKDLGGFDWTFTEVDHFTDAAYADTLAQIREVIQKAQMGNSAYSRPIRLMGDSDEMAIARASKPAHTLLREHLDWWIKHNENGPRWPKDDNPDGIRAYHDHVSVSVEGYSVVYLLAALNKFSPVVADVAARNLMLAWDSGELGEWMYQWGQELTAGQPLTLHGIPDADPLVADQDGGLAPTEPPAQDPEPTRFPTPGFNFVDRDGQSRGVTAVRRDGGGVFRVDYLDGDPEYYALLSVGPLDSAE